MSGLFQAQVSAWMAQCFVPSLYSNMIERGDRLLEEVLETLQAHDYPPERVATLVQYVWSRPKGEPGQEVGGVMVTLAGFCWIAGLDMHAEGHRELARINRPEVMAKIRAKQEAKNALHFDTPLPGDASQPRGEATGDTTTFAEAWERLTPRDRAIISAYFSEVGRQLRRPKHCPCGEGILHSPGEFPWCRAGVAPAEGA